MAREIDSSPLTRTPQDQIPRKAVCYGTAARAVEDQIAETAPEEIPELEIPHEVVRRPPFTHAGVT
ncbi:MAG: hypothetical protein OEY77_03075, partial [Nitrospira sp.]|nr:hypothetical protein [Nitrospira sp.]